MLKYFLLMSAVASSLCAAAQDFPGFRTSNYSGVNGIAFNPANLADNRYGFDFNLVSLNTSIGNNQLSFNLKTIGETFSEDKLENTFLKQNSGRTNALLGFTLNTPSFMFSAGRNLGFGVTTRARIFGTIKDLEGRLLSSETDENGLDPNLPYSFGKGADMKVAAHVFSEIGVSSGFVVLNQDEHFIKGGITAKYLIGVGNAFYNISGLSGTIDQEADDRGPFLRDANGRIAIGMGGINIDGDNFDELFSTSSRGFGADLGFVYEWRPDYEKYKTESGDLTKEKNKYKLKFGVALNDIGRLKYTKDMDRSADYNINIAGANRVHIDEIGAGEDETVSDYFKSRPDAFTPVAGNSDESYTVNLPTTLNVEIDYQIREKVYVNLHTMLPVGNSTLPSNNKLYTNIAVTPRFETRGIGFFLPIQYNGLTKLNAGFAMRLGPLFFGSGSVLTALLGSSKQADVHVGLRFGTFRRDKHKKVKKEDKELSSVTN